MFSCPALKNPLYPHVYTNISTLTSPPIPPPTHASPCAATHVHASGPFAFKVPHAMCFSNPHTSNLLVTPGKLHEEYQKAPWVTLSGLNFHPGCLYHPPATNPKVPDRFSAPLNPTSHATPNIDQTIFWVPQLVSLYAGGGTFYIFHHHLLQVL